jgi:hypothetical protein
MGKIISSDILYIAITSHGKQIASLSVSGLTTVTEVMQTLHRQAAGAGLVKFTIRNGSQGWNYTSTVRLA